jgi:hypothetical protein
LGIRNLRMFNRALLGKWLWHFGIERNAWWRTVVESNFGCLRGRYCSNVPTGAFGVGLWNKENVGRLSGYTRFEVGDGTRINFWHDLWVGNMTLKAAFLALFGIAAAKDAVVVNNLEFLGGSNEWNVSFAREAHGYAHFMNMLLPNRSPEDPCCTIFSLCSS